MTAWAWHQLVHLALVLCLIGVGYSLAHGAAAVMSMFVFAVAWFSYRAHLYHHAKSGVGDHA